MTLGLDDPDDAESLRARVARKLGLLPQEIPLPVVLRRALDARGKRLRYHLELALSSEAADGYFEAGALPRSTRPLPRVVIVGDGPAGLFCAYALACDGVRSIVVDRGKKVQPRRHDLVSVQQRGWVDPDSNYCYGEGGAGTFSDGKLYTRATKRGNVRRVLSILVAHGAPSQILVDARPHIGSNRLPKVVTALRERLEAVGVEFRFESRVVGLETTGDQGAPKALGVRLRDGSTVEGDAVVVATGHSARDVYLWLADAGCRMKKKGFAVGVRVEHPQAVINRAQYGRHACHPKLPNADYRLVTKVGERGVFSFCMCPGGWIVPSSTEADGVVVNGMSLSRRDSPFANSGIVVSVEPEDLTHLIGDDPLGGLWWQRELEQRAYRAGGGAFRAPATRLTDFLSQRGSTTLPATSYVPGLSPGNLAELLDEGRLPLSSALRQALKRFGVELRGFITSEAVLVGVESRTSSPVRVERDPATLACTVVKKLYHAGEGAGYSGGIVSAALDGMRVAQAIVEGFGVGVEPRR